MKARRSKENFNEEEYEKKLKELDEFQNFISIADKFISPDDLIKSIIQETLIKMPSDILIPKKAKKPKKVKKKCKIM
jgi:hypothetical protein